MSIFPTQISSLSLTFTIFSVAAKEITLILHLHNNVEPLSLSLSLEIESRALSVTCSLLVITLF